MQLDALALLDGGSDALEAFLGTCLTAHGLWDSPRVSDGIADTKVLEAGSANLVVVGRVWLVADQQQETFCLALEVEPGAGQRARWTIRYRLVGFGRGRARDLRDAWQLLQRPDDASWAHTVSGHATVRAGRLAPVGADGQPL